jgi:hypothetical protein
MGIQFAPQDLYVENTAPPKGAQCFAYENMFNDLLSQQRMHLMYGIDGGLNCSLHDSVHRPLPQEDDYDGMRRPVRIQSQNTLYKFGRPPFLSSSE